VDETLKLQIANLLNGIPVEEVARIAGETPAEITTRFLSVMKLVAEYELVHCVPYFPCGSVAEACRNRLRVLDVLGAIERWDAIERDFMLDLLKEKKGIDYGFDRATARKIWERTLDAVPNYLDKTELPAYFRDRTAFLSARRARVIAAVDKFVSLRNPLIYKHIEHIGMDAANAVDVATSLTH